MSRIAIIPGDGIGVEVTREAARVLEAARDAFGLDLSLETYDMGAERYLRDGVTITEDEFRTLSDDADAILLGALGDPRVPGQVHARDILLGLRFRLDLYVNYRPCVLLDPRFCPLREAEGRTIDLDIFRENTEGLYVNAGGVLREGTPHEVATQEMINTRHGVERIVRAAFEHAQRHGRGRVTLVDKANAMPIAGGLWRRTFTEVAEAFPGIETDTMYVDAMAMDLVRRPERYQVIVTSNLFGDILSDLAAEITGGLGLAPSANVHPCRHALFEPVHGSAPDIAGQGKANPIGAVRCVALLLEHLGHGAAAAAVDAAVRRTVADGVLTPDLGGAASTEQVGAHVADAVRGAAPAANAV
ncbi:MAG: 3-isopropylmalate dehydrogenase [Gemmatimonadetes bacterium]|nr:MAG: 3-isopropylmalate dehydrogenase [Gemmatimonadota bacterium]